MTFGYPSIYRNLITCLASEKAILKRAKSKSIKFYLFVEKSYKWTQFRQKIIKKYEI